MVKICVIALVGLPAAGKTTFCENMVKLLVEFNCIHVCYDQVFTLIPNGGTSSFKAERRNVLQQVEEIIRNIKSPAAISATHSKHKTSNVFIIFCDDNNYYAGMRYEVFKLCREQQLSFGQIYFPLNLEVALIRNSKRITGALPNNVIESMNERLEAPSSKNQWEKHTLTIDGGYDIQKVQSFLEKCIASPLQAIHDTGDIEKVHEKSNPVHQADILLRKHIKELLKNCDGDLGERAKVLNARRKLILTEAKTKEIPLTVDYLLERLLSDDG